MRSGNVGHGFERSIDENYVRLCVKGCVNKIWKRILVWFLSCRLNSIGVIRIIAI